MTLRGYRLNLGWTPNQLAKAAKIARQTAVNAEAGKVVTAPTAKAIADALSRAYSRTISVTDIEGLNIR